MLTVEQKLERQIEELIKQNAALASENETMNAKLADMESQEPFAWFLDINFNENIAGPYRSKEKAELAELVVDAEYKKVLPLYSKPVPADKPAVAVPDSIIEALRQAVMVVAYRSADIDTEDGSYATTDTDCIIRLESALCEALGTRYDDIDLDEAINLLENLSSESVSQGLMAASYARDALFYKAELDKVLAAAPSYSQQSAESEADGMVEFITDLKRSREKYPKNTRMFDGLIGEVYELKRAYSGDGDVRAEAFDVAVCAFRIATEGDAGGNTILEESMNFWKSFLGVACDNIGK